MTSTTEGDPRPVPASGSAKQESVEELTRRNVDRVLAIETADQEKSSIGDRIADAVTSFSGSMRFVWINSLFIGGWILFNVAMPGPRRFDPFPFPLLTLALSVLAIFLAIFILISQNRAARVSEKRTRMDLQLTMLSEQENTKMLLMLEQIGQVVGAEMSADPDVQALAQTTEPEALSEQLDRAANAPEPRPPSEGH